MNVQFILNKIRLEQDLYSDADTAELLRVSRSALSNWKQRGKMPLKIIQRYCNENKFIIDDYIGKKNIIKVNTTEREEGVNLQNTIKAQEYALQLQKEKIERLESDLNKHKSTPIQNSVWTNLNFDFECEVKLTFKNFKMGRTLLSITNKEIQSQVLGYNINELEKLWNIGTHYKNSKDHPADKILHSNTLKNISDQIKSLPNIFDSLKNMMGNHYIPQPLTYVCKDKSLVNAIAYNKVDWKEKTVSSKIKFLLNE